MDNLTPDDILSLLPPRTYQYTFEYDLALTVDLGNRFAKAHVLVETQVPLTSHQQMEMGQALLKPNKVRWTPRVVLKSPENS